FRSVRLAGHGRRGRNHNSVLLIGWRRSVAELHGIAAFQAKSEAALWAIQCPGAAHYDVFKICVFAAIQCGLEGLIRIQIHKTDSILENALGVGAGLVWVKLLIAIGRVRRNGNKSFLGGSADADSERLVYPRIS